MRDFEKAVVSDIDLELRKENKLGLRMGHMMGCRLEFLKEYL